MTAQVRDPDALREWIDHRGSSVRKVAEVATRLGEREREKKRNLPQVKVHHSTVGHLISGHQKSVSTRRAELIEKALDVPMGSLFLYKLTNVSEAISGKGAAA